MELFEIQFRMKRVFASYFNQSHLKLWTVNIHNFELVLVKIPKQKGNVPSPDN